MLEIGKKVWTYARPLGVVWGIVSEIKGEIVVLNAGSFSSNVSLQVGKSSCHQRKSEVKNPYSTRKGKSVDMEAKGNVPVLAAVVSQPDSWIMSDLLNGNVSKTGVSDSVAKPARRSPIAGGISNLCYDYSFFLRSKATGTGSFNIADVGNALNDAKRMAFALEDLEKRTDNPELLSIIRNALKNREED